MAAVLLFVFLSLHQWWLAQEELWGCLWAMRLQRCSFTSPKSVTARKHYEVSDYLWFTTRAECTKQKHESLIMSWNHSPCRTPLSQSCAFLPLKVSVFLVLEEVNITCQPKTTLSSLNMSEIFCPVPTVMYVYGAFSLTAERVHFLCTQWEPCEHDVWHHK